jgi:hypothetical protein
MIVETDGINSDMHNLALTPCNDPDNATSGVFKKILLVVISLLFAATCSSAPTVNIDVTGGSGQKEQVPRVYGFGGNIWHIPEAFSAGLAESIHMMPHLGITRVSLGDLILEDAENIEDVRRRLRDFPLNDFLRRYAASGGRVLFILDGVPRWLSSNRSREIHRGPDQPIFRVSPPADMIGWSEVVEAIVRHFNGNLGLDAYYEAWNEPNYYYLGNTAQFLQQYRYTVLGARRADPAAKVGGPSVSEFIGIGTAGTETKSADDKRRLLTMLMDQQYLFRQFLDIASRTPLPELGLKRLPVDFFSWHSFYIDPTRYYGAVVPAIRQSLSDTGYSARTPLIVTEWNIAAVPPYPEGDLNANEVGAAYVATSLLAMHASGIEGQIFQMYVDPGSNGYYGGMYTVSGVPRANYNAFRLFTQVKGREIQTESSDSWAKSVAFKDGKNTYLLVTTFVPTTQMLVNTQKIRSALDNARETRAMASQGLGDVLVSGKGVPEPIASRMREILTRNQAQIKGDLDKASAWKSGVNLEIRLDEYPAKVAHFLIDSKHSNIYRDLDKAKHFLSETSRRMQVGDNLNSRLTEAGLTGPERERLMEQLKQRKPMNDALQSLPDNKRAKGEAIVRQYTQDKQHQYMAALEEIGNWSSARQFQESITPAAGNILRVQAEPYSVHLFVISGN